MGVRIGRVDDLKSPQLFLMDSLRDALAVGEDTEKLIGK